MLVCTEEAASQIRALAGTNGRTLIVCETPWGLRVNDVRGEPGWEPWDAVLDTLQDDPWPIDAGERAIFARLGPSPAPSQAPLVNDLHTKLRAAITGNQDALTQVAAATANVQTVIDGSAANIGEANAALDVLANTVKNMIVQQERMMRQLTGLERLLIGADLLVENTDT
jgi:hypothetical protein